MNGVTIIGTGNVGTHLYEVFTENKVRVDAVWSRSEKQIERGSISLRARTSTLDFSESSSEIFIICLPDDAIPEIVSQLKIPANVVVAHTSGSVEMEVLKSVSDHYGIFYPLQTFTKGRQVDFKKIPMLLEASDTQTMLKLETLARLISENVQYCNSEKRSQIHLAAVFACNFTNRILGISEDLLNEKGLDLSLLKPLVEETLTKSFELGPIAAQTGPAQRGDTATMEKHLKMLEGTAEYRELYELVSGMIKAL